jgi:hypothetical protein
MNKKKNNAKKETNVLVYDADRLRLKKIAYQEDRTMKFMFKAILDAWEKKDD